MYFVNVIVESDTWIEVLTVDVYKKSSTHVDFIIGDYINFDVCFRIYIFKCFVWANQIVHYYLAKYILNNQHCMWFEDTSSYIYAVLNFDLLLEFC